MLGSSHIPMVSTTSPPALRNGGPALAAIGQQGAFNGFATSIMLPYGDETNENDLSEILASIPSRRDSDILVEECASF